MVLSRWGPAYSAERDVLATMSVDERSGGHQSQLSTSRAIDTDNCRFSRATQFSDCIGLVGDGGDGTGNRMHHGNERSSACSIMLLMTHHV